MRLVALIFFALATVQFVRADPIVRAPAPHVAPKKIAATVESSLASNKRNIRQYAFDGNDNTYFASEKNAGKADYFSVVFDTPVAVSLVSVLTGKSEDGDAKLDKGVLESSSDGKKFEPLAKFVNGEASAKPKGKMIKALRIRPAEDLDHPLVIREILIDSKPSVTTFKYPIEFVVDVTDAPEMKEWAEKAARNCERQYAMICEELMSPGFKPHTLITMSLKSDYNGVAEAGNDRIRGSVKYFKSHPDDLGAMVHETVHCVQLYRSRRNPGWLVEGVADYIRFFKYEPGKIGRMNLDQARYDGSYRVTAAFLNFVTEKYDSSLVKKLNTAMREGKYSEDIWMELTGKTIEQLNQEWRRSFGR